MFCVISNTYYYYLKYSSLQIIFTDVCESVSYRFGAVDISCQADNQVMCDGVNKVSEAGVAVQHVIQGCWLHTQVLHTQTNTHTHIK